MISYFIPIPLWVVIAIPAGKFLKFLIVYPIVRQSVKQPLRSGIESLIGMRGLTVEAIDPEGYVNARGELWRAVSNDASIPAGAKVEVCGLDRTKLVLRSLE
jgi:membrane-bound ClpP family serine protease